MKLYFPLILLIFFLNHFPVYSDYNSLQKNNENDIILNKASTLKFNWTGAVQRNTVDI
jgi:hypothetical protein